jgi:ArsR family transcriptional regulator
MGEHATSDVAVRELEAGLCRALGDVTRLRIVYALAGGPLSVGILCHRLGASQPAVSRHLKVLRDQSLVSASRQGQFVQYELRDANVLEALGMLRRVLTQNMIMETAVYEEARA